MGMGPAQSPWSLEGQVALVVGGSRGIGRAIAEALAGLGARIAIVSRSEESVSSACADIQAKGGEAIGIAADVSRVDDISRFVHATTAKWGRIDILINNAGINPIWKRPENVGEDDWDSIMGVNLRGAFFACREVGKIMIAQGSGRIVSISSVTGLTGTARGLPYTAAKAGLHAMTQTLAADWSHHGIRINVVAPGYVETDLTAAMRQNKGIFDSIAAKIPLGRFAQPAEMVDLVIYLASEVSSYVTGQIFVVDGGYSAVR
jgi:NAD(P)-dependent dehydrogenase (short-subunit alcohol dehydrogenase family)